VGKPEQPAAHNRRTLLAWLVETKALYIVLVLLLALYVLTKNPLVAVLTALDLVTLFLAESVHSASHGGWKNELKELGLTLILAAAIWFGGGFLLQTSAPLDSVVSCSMVPNLERGDMVVLHGGVPNAPEVAVPRAAFEQNDWPRQALVCALCADTRVPCVAANGTLSAIRDKNGILIPVAPTEANQSGNLIKFGCGTCTRAFSNGSTSSVPCTTSIAIDGTNVTVAPPAAGNGVGAREEIVYTTAPGDVFSGEIIHRVVARLNVEGSYYYLTKGDNNEALDLQWGNSIIPQKRVVGHVLARLPYVGYLKLFLFGYFSPIGNCDSTLAAR